jgi:hypothetical protein
MAKPPADDEILEEIAFGRCLKMAVCQSAFHVLLEMPGDS